MRIIIQYNYVLSFLYSLVAVLFVVAINTNVAVVVAVLFIGDKIKCWKVNTKKCLVKNRW